ncbi:MAG: hypothetical protein U9Q82_16240, partial [Chloroflexota bacterium]|nr:hypothetical protein [Chloroflexota bacterium]
SLAIGRSGQNARLTAKLTGWRIDIKSLVEATSDVLFKLQNDPDYAEFSAQEKEIIPRIEAVMAKKAEGRPIMPEEYRELQSFTIRVENSVSEQRRETQRNHELLLEAAHEAVPKGAYDLPLLIMGFPTRINTLLEESGINSVGDLIFQMSFDAEDIEEIDGIGVKSIKKIEDAVELMTQIEPQFEDADVSDAPDELGVSAEPDISEEADEEPLTSTEEIIKPKSETPEPALEGKEITEEEQEDQSDKSGKYVDVEYDPDHDVMIYKKRHKREKEDWDKWEGELDDDSLDNV